MTCETFGGNIERFLEEWSGDIHMGDGLAKTVYFLRILLYEIDYFMAHKLNDTQSNINICIFVSV